MVHDSPPHHVFKISELTRLITSHLTLIDQKSVVDLACACRYLEEPVLSTLWETQSSMRTLLKVLPEEFQECLYLPGKPMKHVVRSLDLPSEKLNT